MSEPDLSPVKPYPGYAEAMAEGVAAALDASFAFPGAPEIRPANPGAWSTTVPLDHPLVVEGQTLGSISIRRATGADIAELMEEDPREATLPARLRALICGVHPAVFGALSADDSERVAEALRPFLPRAVVAIEEALAAEPRA